MVRRLIILIMSINMIWVSGCWNYNEIDDFRLVSGVAIDYDKKNEKYIFTTEIINPAHEELEFSGEIFQTEGESIFDAIRDLISKTGRKLYWAHSEVIIISEDIAKQGVIPSIDMFLRDAEMKSDMWIAISKESTAREILQLEVDRLHSINAYHIDEILDTEKSISLFHGVNLWRFSKDLYAEGISPTLPIVRLYSHEDHLIPKVGGTAVFSGDQMVGTLDETETKFYLGIIDKLKGGTIIVEPVIENGLTYVTLKVISCNTKLKPEYVNDKLTMNVDIELTVNIAEISGDRDFIGKKGLNVLKEHTVEFVEKNTLAVVEKVKENYHSDIFGFSTSLKRNMPEVWKELKSDWKNEFSNIDVKVDCKLNVRGSSLLNKPLQIMK